VALVGVTAAVGAGAVAWSKYQANAEAALKAAEDRAARLREQLAKDQQNLIEHGDRSVAAALSPAERERRIRQQIEVEREFSNKAQAILGQSRLDEADPRFPSVFSRDETIRGARELARSARRQEELTKDLFNIEKQQLEESRRNTQSFITNLFGSTPVGNVFETINNANTTRQVEQLEKTFTTAIDKLINVSRDAITKANKLEAETQSPR
jgi:hypothetical protein